LYWTWISRVRQVGGRERVSKKIRTLIFRMVSENPTWGAPRIHGELLKLGFDVSERSVAMDPASPKRSRFRETMTDSLGCSRDSIGRNVRVLADWPRDGFRTPRGRVRHRCDALQP
jgi:hypothetical protein